MTIQEIFEMRKNHQYEEAYAAVLPMYREHHGHYTTLCMFWTATDVMRLRIEAARCTEAEQILASLRNLYHNMQDKDLSAARTLNRLALMLAAKEQELRCVHFSLLDYLEDFGGDYITAEDWESSEWNGHPVPSNGVKIVSRLFHELATDSEADEERLRKGLKYVEQGLQYAARNKHMLRYQANLLYRLGEKQRAIALYRQLIARSKEAYLYSELAGMIEDKQEQVVLLAKAIVNQRTEVFAQKDRLSMAVLLKELFPQNAAYELQKVIELRTSIGLHMNRTIVRLQSDLAGVAPVTMADQREFYMRLLKEQRMCA